MCVVLNEKRCVMPVMLVSDSWLYSVLLWQSCMIVVVNVVGALVMSILLLLMRRTFLIVTGAVIIGRLRVTVRPIPFPMLVLQCSGVIEIW